MNGIHTVNDLMNAAAVAMQERDEERLLELVDVVNGWLQGDDERLAQLAVLNAMLEAVAELEEV